MLSGHQNFAASPRFVASALEFCAVGGLALALALWPYVHDPYNRLGPNFWLAVILCLDMALIFWRCISA